MEWNIDLAKKLFFRFSIIWGNSFTSQYPSPEFIDMWAQDWYEGLKGVSIEDIKSAIEHCRLNNEWAPKLPEFRKLCERSLCIPSPSECMQLAIRRDFSQPIVKAIFDRVGSWDMSHDKETVLLKKFQQYHAEELANLRKGTVKQLPVDRVGLASPKDFLRVIN